MDFDPDGPEIKLKCIFQWIRIGFNADPDPAFYLEVNPDSGSLNQGGSLRI